MLDALPARIAMRQLAAAIALGLGLAAIVAPARGQDSRLPDIGSSAAGMVDPSMEADYGAYVLYELRRMGLVLDDPLVDAWLQAMGYRLAAASETPRQSFTFFMLRDRQINAFATLGGVIGVNAGLVLTAENESEVAGVVAHEIAHVSQRHVLRAVERAKKDQIPILLAMIGMIAAAQATADDDGGSRRDDSAGNATAAAVTGAMGLMAQRQIDYTRSNESEADRIGIQTLAGAGYAPDGMADFFERMQRASRGDSGGYQLPEYLRSHPVTTTRISETRQRAARLAAAPARAGAGVRAPDNPLLPGDLRLGPASDAALAADPGQFVWVRERLRVLSASDPAAALREYRAMERSPDGAGLADGRRYGMALAQMRAGQPDAADAVLAGLLERHPGHLWLELARAEAASQSREHALADERFDRLLARHPDSRAVRLAYAQSLSERGTPAAGRRAQEVLRPLLADGATDPLFQRTFARASELAGDLVRAGEAYAETAYLNGRAVDALNQLDALKNRGDLTYYQRARIEARIAAITPIVLEMRRQGIDPHEQRPDTL
jgi:predicted Zn-dependent protease